MSVTKDNKSKLGEWLQTNLILVIGTIKHYQKVGNKEYYPWCERVLKELTELTNTEYLNDVGDRK